MCVCVSLENTAHIKYGVVDENKKKNAIRERFITERRDIEENKWRWNQLFKKRAKLSCLRSPRPKVANEVCLFYLDSWHSATSVTLHQSVRPYTRVVAVNIYVLAFWSNYRLLCFNPFIYLSCVDLEPPPLTGAFTVYQHSSTDGSSLQLVLSDKSIFVLLALAHFDTLWWMGIFFHCANNTIQRGREVRVFQVTS